MGQSKAIGTAAETAVVKAATAYGLHAERRALKGSGDDGDVHITLESGYTLVVEVKSGEQTRNPSWAQLSKWWNEAVLEASRVQFGIPVLVVRRWGSGQAADWWAHISLLGLPRLGLVAGATGRERNVRVQLRFGDLLGAIRGAE